MAERLQLNPEQQPEKQEALDATAQERNKDLEKSRERAAELAPERSVETSVAEAKEAAAKAEKTAKPETSKAEKRRDTPAQRRAKAKASYKKTMKETQDQLPPASRAFSKVIHTPAVEKVSEVVGSTVARPNAILAGSVTAFVLTLLVYLIAQHYGYPLSGFETIAAFIFGWAVGLLFDYLKVMITGKRA